MFQPNPRSRSLLIALLAAGSPYVIAQTITTGAISGVVRDPSGQAAQGVLIRASSGQVVRSIASDASGAFRLSLLNPGEWTLTITKEGMQTTAAKVLVQTNGTQSVNLRLIPVASATVAVTAGTELIDVTAVQTGTTLTQEVIGVLPSSRSIMDVYSLTPGVFKTAGNELSISGATANDNEFVTDGLVTNDWRRGTSGKVLLPQEWFEQIDVITGGFRPEYTALGGVVNAVTRSGSNTFAADAQVFSTFPNAQSRDFHFDPTNPVLTAQRPNQNTEYGFSVAGPIVKDRLFYFVGLNRTESTGVADSFPSNYDGLRASPNETKSWTGLAKVNYFPSTNHQLTLSASYTRTDTGQEHIYKEYGTADEGALTRSKNTNLNLTWDWNILSNLLLSTRFGQSKIETSAVTVAVDAPGSYYLGDFMYWELGPGVNRPKPANYAALKGFVPYYTSNGGGGVYPKDDYRNTQFRVDLSWYAGKHALKFGYSQQQPDYDVVAKSTGLGVLLYGLQLNRTSMMQFTYDQSGRGQNVIRSYYAQDTWEVAAGVRVIYGARYETQQATNGKGVRFWDFSGLSDLIQPRLGLSWDLNNDGKTKFFASWGRYYETIPIEPVRLSGSDTFKRTNIYLTRVIGNPYPTDPIATATYNPATGVPGITGAPMVSINQTLASEVPTIEKDIKLTRREEWILGWEQMLGNGYSLSTNFKFRELKDPIDASYLTDATGKSLLNLNDSSPAQLFWNPRPGVVSFNVGRAVPGVGGTVQSYNMGLYHKPVNRYYSLGFVLNKKADRWMGNLSYVFSRAYGNYDGTGTVGSNYYFVPNNTGSWHYYYGGDWSGPLSFDRTHVFKAQGNYRLPLFGNDLNLGLSARFETGTPRTTQVPASVVYPALTNLNAAVWNVPEGRIPGNNGRTPTFANLDLNLAYPIKTGRIQVTPTLNIFNLFNQRTPTGYVDSRLTQSQQTGVVSAYPYFGMITDKQQGRWMNLGVKVKF